VLISFGDASLAHLIKAGSAVAAEFLIFSEAKNRVKPKRISETYSMY
jgi:hypothetical protein